MRDQSTSLSAVGGPRKVAMIFYDRWRDGLCFPATVVRLEDRFARYGICATVPPTPPFERVEEWIICARDEQEAHRTVQYHFGRSVVRYELGQPYSPNPRR